jgi:microcystin-dependent protein
MCVALLIIIVIMIICFLRNSKEDFRFNISSASSMVLTDSDGNLSSIPFPKGIVVIWSGNLADIPKGWALCDGTQGTPDLRGRFVLGVNPSDNKNDLTARPMKTTGGAETHTLTVEEMPRHKHTYKFPAMQINAKQEGFAGNNDDTRVDTRDTSFVGGTPPASGATDAEGPGQPHNNMPPYFALAYIMKM